MGSKRDWWKTHYRKYSSKPIPLPKGHKIPGHRKTPTLQGVKLHSYFSVGKISWSAPTLSHSLCWALAQQPLTQKHAHFAEHHSEHDCGSGRCQMAERADLGFCSKDCWKAHGCYRHLLSNLGGCLSRGCELGTTGCLSTRKWDSSQQKPVCWVRWGV